MIKRLICVVAVAVAMCMVPMEAEAGGCKSGRCSRPVLRTAVAVGKAPVKMVGRIFKRGCKKGCNRGPCRGGRCSR